MDSTGIIALLLAVPFSILANLVTPIVKDWLALSSKSIAARRVKDLERELAEVKSGELSFIVLKLLRYVFLTLMFVIFGVLAQVVKSINPADASKYNITSYFMLIIACYLTVSGGGECTKRLNEGHKKYLEKTIASLKKKLQQKTRTAVGG
jgi:hypothetical protein